MTRGAKKGVLQGNAGKGRPKGAKNKVNQQMLREMALAQRRKDIPLTPLMFMLQTLGNKSNSFSKRAWAAEKAAPYIHRKMPLAVEGGDPTRPILLASAEHLRSLSSAEFTQLQALSMKLITEKLVEEAAEEEDANEAQ